MKKNLLTTLFITLGFAICGASLRAQQWTTALEGVWMMDGFRTDDNTVVMVGRTTDGDAFERGVLVRLYGDGQYDLTEFPSDGRHVELESVFPLPDGGYLAIGKRFAEAFPSDYGDLLVLVLDADLGVVSERAIQAEGFDGFDGTGSMIDDDGTIVVMASARRPGNIGNIEHRGVMFRFSREGETLQCRYLVADLPDPLAYLSAMRYQQMFNDPYSDRVVALCPGRYGSESVLLFDPEFNLLEEHQIEDISIPDTVVHYLRCRIVYSPKSDHWCGEGEMLVSAYQHDTTAGVHNIPHVLVGRMGLDGEINRKVDIHRNDTLFYSYGGMAYHDDTTVYVATRCHTWSADRPFYPHVYLLSEEPELLGRVELWDDLNHEAVKVFATDDGGCIVAEIHGEDGVHIDTKFRRFTREDFHPISISVEETPMATPRAAAFPNPAVDEVNIDLSGLPDGDVRRIRITDTQGRPCLDRIIRGEGNTLTLGIGPLAPGVYHYAVYNRDAVVLSGTFIKE